MGDDERAVECGNCQWDGIESELGCDLASAPNLWERLDPGSEVPVGECPECGAFAYVKEKNKMSEEEKEKVAANDYPFQTHDEAWKAFYRRITEGAIHEIECIQDGREVDPEGLFSTIDRWSYYSACKTFGKICKEYLGHNPQFVTDEEESAGAVKEPTAPSPSPQSDLDLDDQEHGDHE